MVDAINESSGSSETGYTIFGEEPEKGREATPPGYSGQSTIHPSIPPNTQQVHIHYHEKKADEEKSQKSFFVTLLLQFFLGYVGFPHFYVGNIGKGLLTLGTTICLGWITFGIVPGIVWLYNIFQIILGNFTDSEGKKVRN
ncbi:TM2 domain-containing protein [Simkania sp.]|uniref:TM2 domain-containing protein n=1 Tax=Simkania sp. TaxID=34094 RepID=UPI003B5183C8